MQSASCTQLCLLQSRVGTQQTVLAPGVVSVVAMAPGCWAQGGGPGRAELTTWEWHDATHVSAGRVGTVTLARVQRLIARQKSDRDVPFWQRYLLRRLGRRTSTSFF